MITVLNPFNKNQSFPDVQKALEQPNGLLAVGGCLSAQRLKNAYRRGIFPWYGQGEPILWWSPDPRLILFPESIKVSRSMRKRLRRSEFIFTFDTCFKDIMEACSRPRSYTTGTWITAEVKRAYTELHQLGCAHSFEVWHQDKLVGGLYGVAIGRIFFGESMFHEITDASKAALIFACHCLIKWNYKLIDCQVHTDHLASLGAIEIPRAHFIEYLNRYCDIPPNREAWIVEPPLLLNSLYSSENTF